MTHPLLNIVFTLCPTFLSCFLFLYRFGNRGFIITTAILLVAHFITTAVIIAHYDLNTSMLGGGENP